MEKVDDTKEEIKKMNVDAVAKVLTNIQDDNHKIRSEQLDLRRMATKVTQDVASLQAEIHALKAMGLRGNMGTGSTVHNRGE